MASFGEKLRRERESRNTTIDQIASTTKIQRGYLEALEDNKFDGLPGSAFGKFYIRAYAELLGFDPAPLIADYDRERYRRNRQDLGGAPAPPKEKRARRRPRAWLQSPAEPAQPSPPPVEPEETEVPVETEVQPAVEAVPEVAEPAPPAPPRSRRKTVVWLSVAAVAGLLWILISTFGAGAPDPEPSVEARVAEPAEPAKETPNETAAPEVPRNPSRLDVPEFGIGRRVVHRRLEGQSRRFEEGAVAWFSTRVVGGEPGDSIHHAWLREGRLVESISLELGGAHWRTHSHKTLWGVGQWTVEARDAEGHVLAAVSFECLPAGTL